MHVYGWNSGHIVDELKATPTSLKCLGKQSIDYLFSNKEPLLPKSTTCQGSIHAISLVYKMNINYCGIDVIVKLSRLVA